MAFGRYHHQPEFLYRPVSWKSHQRRKNRTAKVPFSAVLALFLNARQMGPAGQKQNCQHTYEPKTLGKGLNSSEHMYTSQLHTLAGRLLPRLDA